MRDLPVALLLAAGLGTRLGELSAERPKPLLPVGNWPLIRWGAGLCLHHGLSELCVNLHHLGEQIQAEFGDGSAFGAQVSYSHEPAILGTGGGIKAMAARFPGRTLIACNAKIVSDIDLTALLAFHRARRALATVVLYPVDNPERWGALGLGPDGRLIRLLDERLPGFGPSSDAMFTGVQVLEPDFIAAIPEGSCCIIRTAYRRLLLAGAPIYGVLHRGYFQEHSTPARYLQGNLNLLARRVDPPGKPGPLTGVSPSATIDPSAELVPPLLVGPGVQVGAGARVGPEVVIGAGAQLAPKVRLAQAVVWDGVRVEASAQRAILTPQRTIQVLDDEASPRR